MGFYRVTKKQSGEGIPLITKSGSIVEYEDSVGGVPVNDLVASIVAAQSGSGDPSPSNVRPISGFTGVNVTRAGVNIFNPSTITANTWFSDVDGSTASQNGYVVTDFIKINGGASYYKGDNGSGRILFYDKDKNSITSAWNVMSSSATAFTAPSPACYIRLTILSTKLSGFFVNSDSTDTNYHAYNGTTYSVTWQSEAGTVYGGYIDLTTGLLTVTHGIKEFDYTTDWHYEVAAAGKNFYVEMGDEYQDVQYSITNGLICNVAMPSTIGGTQRDKFFISMIKNFNWTCGETLNLSSVQDLQDYLRINNLTVQVCAKLATPQTYQLTPTEVATILGINHIFADTGNVSVKFYKPVTNFDTLVEQTKSLAPDIIALASAGNGTSTREAFDMTDETTGTKTTRIPDYMFYKNLNVEKINLSTVEVVGSNSFYMCPYIKEISLPNTTELKSSAFNASSRSLTSPTPMVINLPSCTNIADSALREMGYAGTPCTITLTACETLQGNAIRGASARYFTIDTLDLPAVKTIGQECLNYHQFTNVIIGTACTSIASKPFNYCTITNLTVKATTPPTLNANGLGCTPTHIYVPTDSVATYKAASNWSTYASIIEAIPT